MNSHGSDALVGEFLYNSTFDGNGHTLTVAGASKSLFTDVTNSTIKNLTLNFDDCSGYSLLSMYLDGAVVENVTTEGSVSSLASNCGLLSYYSFNTCKYIDCVNNADITGSGNISVFGGYIKKIAEYENCVNNGTVRGAQAAMFGSCCDNGATLKVTNCENNDVINFMTQKYSSSVSRYLDQNYYIAYKSYQLSNLNVDGESLDVETTAAIAGSGICVFGSESLSMTMNADKTVTFNKSTDNAVSYYEVSMLVYGTSSDNSTLRYYATERIDSTGAETYTSTMKYLNFVNSDDAAYTDAGTLAGNPVVKDAGGNLFYTYPVTTKDGRTFRLKNAVMNASSIVITAYNANNDPIAFGSLKP